MNPAVLRLLHLASPTLPVGAYTYSQGLEWAVEAGTVKDEATALAWIGDVLELRRRRAARRCYLARMLAAWRERDDARLARLDEDFLASRETAELRAETVQMGHSLRAPARDLRGMRRPARLAGFAAAELPAGVELRGGRAGTIPTEDALAAYLWAWAENQVMAAAEGRAARPDRRPAPAAGARATACPAWRRSAPPRPSRTHAATSRPASPSPAPPRNPVLAGCSAHEHSNATSARRHRRPGRLRQDRADPGAVPGPARPVQHRRRHQRHLHRGGRPVPGAQRGAGAGAHHRRRDRRLPAHGDPRGRLDQPRSGRPAQRALPRPGRSSSSKAAATTSPPPSARSSPT